MRDRIIDLKQWIEENLFSAMPMSIAVIDRDFNLVLANPAFEEKFGDWQGRKCFSVYKDRDALCPHCKGGEAFKDGLPRVNEEEGFDRHGLLTRYIKHTIPFREKDGSIPFLLEISTDITETERIRQEHQLLFDQVPCNILILDRDLRIVRGNRRFSETFGELDGRYCFEAFKRIDQECVDCPARQTLSDGRVHQAHSVVLDKAGKQVHLQVTTAPLGLEKDFQHVMEMAVDVTHTLKLEESLQAALAMSHAMIATSLDAHMVVDGAGRVKIFNPAARNLFNVPPGHPMTGEELSSMLPEDFMSMVARATAPVSLSDTFISTTDDEKIPVRLVGMRLIGGTRDMGMAFTAQDLRPYKKLEAEKLTAERLAAVGQTVAGLAHGVKNLIMALEGGLYMLNSGLKAGKADRMAQGMDMLTRNTERISVFIKEFLSFSKGRSIRVKPVDPVGIALELVDLYKARAGELDIELTHEKTGEVLPADLDAEAMHECLTNLMANAIDACRMSDKKDPCHVTMNTYEKDGALVFEVSDDGCGMDYEIKKKVFTNFFTTKGSGGTGLGLLTTKKIIQEHGGRIEMESELGEGTIFRIILPRDRLPKPEGRS
ncbi:MAG: PAS domain-containing protein [Proteobacteria bacterium]|nr:PAS domain-containing protein [Pseudomonadota bacterium]